MLYVQFKAPSLGREPFHGKQSTRVLWLALFSSNSGLVASLATMASRKISKISERETVWQTGKVPVIVSVFLCRT